MGKLEKTFDANPDLKIGVGVLLQKEWLDLSAFTDNAIYFKPITEEMLRLEIDLKADKPLPPEFKETIEKYKRLKGYCETFENVILPGTRELANGVVQYSRTAAATYDALIKAIKASQGPSVDIGLGAALIELSRQWKLSHPSEPAIQARRDFAKYVGILMKDAEKRAGAASILHGQIVTFHQNLRLSYAEFGRDSAAYKGKFGEISPKVKKLQAGLDLLQKELDGLRVEEDQKVLLLETAPVYLAIPLIGYLIMSGVLLGAGIHLGVIRKRIAEKVEEASGLAKELGPLQSFMALYEYGETSTLKTADEVKTVLPLVEKIKNAWSDLTSDLKELRDVLTDASGGSLTGDWDVATLKLDIAKATWQDLKGASERYLRYQLKRADDVEEAMKGVVVKEKVA